MSCGEGTFVPGNARSPVHEARRCSRQRAEDGKKARLGPMHVGCVSMVSAEHRLAVPGRIGLRPHGAVLPYCRSDGSIPVRRE